MTVRDAERHLRGAARTAPERDRALGLARVDSRAVRPGDVFFCLPGSKADGHDFAAAAEAAGAALVVTQREAPGLSPALELRVPDVAAALARLARAARDAAAATVVAVTGTAGKTTVKELLAEVCATERRTCRNWRNLNNQIGAPLTILAAEPDAGVWVLELGISHPGDMDELGEIAHPDLAVIHNIGPGHLEGLGSIEGVARAKASLLQYLAPGGRAVVSRDHPLLLAEAKRIVPKPITSSALDPEAPYFCRFEGVTPEGRGRFRLATPGWSAEMTLPTCGAHMAENIAAVAAAACELGISRAGVLAGISALRPAPQRFVCTACGGCTLIDDTYNANPLSMRQAIETARAMAGSRPLILVLGDMLELGAAAAEAHEGIGREARAAAPAAFYFHGGHAADVARGFGANGVPLTPVADPEAAADDLAAILAAAENPVVLVKGSRSCRMERYVEVISRALAARAQGARP
ncbi:MAG: UDP-N-acetylmuramoyl-tripeptide--D-alanyl-D-alanine ligase [Desulfovibrionaceae bacterium]